MAWRREKDKIVQRLQELIPQARTMSISDRKALKKEELQDFAGDAYAFLLDLAFYFEQVENDEARA